MPSNVATWFNTLKQSTPACCVCMGDALGDELGNHVASFVTFCKHGCHMCRGCFDANYSNSQAARNARICDANPRGVAPAVQRVETERRGTFTEVRCPSCRFAYMPSQPDNLVRPCIGLNALAQQLRALKPLVDQDDLALAQAQGEVHGLRNANEYLVEHASANLHRARAAETDLARIRAILDPSARQAAPSRVFVDEADTVGFVPTAPEQLQSYRPPTPEYAPTSPQYVPTSPSYSPNGSPPDEDSYMHWQRQHAHEREEAGRIERERAKRQRRGAGGSA